MKKIPYESGSYYIFDRCYNTFKELFKIHQHESFFVVRSKKNLQYKCCKWRRRSPKNILTDAVIEFSETIHTRSIRRNSDLSNSIMKIKIGSLHS